MKTWRADLRDLRDPLIAKAARFVLDEAGLSTLPEAARFVAGMASVLARQPALARIIAENGRWVEAHAKPDEGVVETKPWGTVDVIAENANVGLYCLNIAPGATLPDHVHFKMREAEMVLSPGLMGWAGDLRLYTLNVGDQRRWPHGLPHGYHNPTEAVTRLLCIDSPPFIPEDEIETGREPL